MPRLASLSGANFSSSQSGSSSSGATLLGYISSISTYDYRAFDINYAENGSVAVWRKGSNSLSLYNNLLAGTGNEFTAVDTVSTTSTGVDTQGFYQCTMNNNYIYLGRPFGNSNEGELDVYAYTSAQVQTPASVGRPNRFSGYQSSNNFGFARIHSAHVGNVLTVQDGYTGRVMGQTNVTTGSPNGNNFFTFNTSQLDFTRGYACVHDNALYHPLGAARFWAAARTPSGNNVTVNVYRDYDGRGDAGSFTAAGNSAEVARHMTGTVVDERTYIVACTGGSNAGTQVYKVVFPIGIGGLPQATLIYSNNSLSSDGSIAVHPGSTARSVILVSAGQVLSTTDIDTAWPNTTWTEHENLLDSIPGITGTRGLTRWKLESNLCVVGTNSGRLHAFDMSGIVNSV